MEKKLKDKIFKYLDKRYKRINNSFCLGSDSNAEKHLVMVFGNIAKNVFDDWCIHIMIDNELISRDHEDDIVLNESEWYGVIFQYDGKRDEEHNTSFKYKGWLFEKRYNEIMYEGARL